jgi:hypothetical protein
MKRQCWSICVGITCLLAGTAWAQVASGPAAGDKVAALRVFAATGPNEGKELDYAAERALKPTVYILVREWDRPVARFMKTLDTEIRQDSAEAAVVAAWLTGQRDATKEYLPRAQQSLKFEHTTLAVFLGDKDAPEGWNVSPDARVTVVVAAGGKVVESFGYRSINETDVPKVRAALRKAAG